MQSTSEQRLMLLRELLTELRERTELRRSAQYMQHGTTSVLLHSVAVAWHSARLLEALRVRYDLRALLRGALLHDYFLYDWHTHKRSVGERMHAFSHPVRALENALACVELDEKEREIIRRHMFPVTLTPPRCREALAVCLTDKWCAVKETFDREAYPELRALCMEILGTC